MTRFFRPALVAVLLASVAACATTPAAVATSETDVAAVEAPATDASAYGLFLSGQVAMNSGDSRSAARYFAQAARAEPEVSSIRERAFTTALTAGDVAGAARVAPRPSARPAPLTAVAAPTGPPQSAAELETARAARAAARSGATEGLARLTRGADALAAGRGREAAEALSGNFGLHEPAAMLLRPWAQASAGNWDAALAPVVPAGEGTATTSFRRLTRALLLEQAGRRAEADAAFGELTTGGESDFTLLLVAKGEYLERTGRRAEAVTLYDAALGRGSTDESLRAARARAAAGRTAPPRPTLRQGAAQSMLLPAVALIAAEQREIGLLYLRLVLRLDPSMDDAWVMAGDTLVQMSDHAAAREAYGRVTAGSDQYSLAQSRLIGSYQSEERLDEALRLAREAAARAPDDQELKLTLAGVLIAKETYPEAVAALEGVDWRSNWRAAYLRGVALERSGRWPEAEVALQAALAQRPNEAELLNYLGYAWIDRGVRLPEASAMLDRAMQASPESGAIVDSVGWARYRLGRYADAVTLLERAVQLEPGDPTINDHLGDAYWRVGRRLEARFQWRRALTLEPEAEVRAAATAKLASDLGADAAGATRSAESR